MMCTWRFFLVIVCSMTFAVIGHAQELTTSQHAVLDGIARGGDGAAWTGLTIGQQYALSDKANAFLENYVTHHQPDGMSADIRWTDFNRTSIYRYDGLGDSASWSGHYLAAQSLRYAVTSDPAILSDIAVTLDAIDFLSRVSGTDGYLARHAITLAAYNDPNNPYARYYGSGGTLGSGEFSDYVYKGGTARDTFDAVNVGLATAYKYVDDPQIQSTVSTLVERIVDHRVNLFAIWFDNFSATAMLRTAATVNPTKYQGDYEYAASLLGTGSNVDVNFEHYFSNNLDFIRLYVLNELETDPGLKTKWENKVSNMWNDAADHRNPHFAAIYLAATGNTDDLRAVAVLEGELQDFPDAPRFDVHRTNSIRTDIEFQTVDDELYALYALPIDDRPGSDFMWQRNPFTLDGGHGGPREVPGLDVILPYWMGRQIGVIDVPALPRLAGDLNGDGFVGQTDLDIVLARWGRTAPLDDPRADNSGDGFVGQIDLSLVLDWWGHGSGAPGPPASPVLEPATLSLLALGGCVLLRRRRRRRPAVQGRLCSE